MITGFSMVMISRLMSGDKRRKEISEIERKRKNVINLNSHGLISSLFARKYNRKA